MDDRCARSFKRCFNLTRAVASAPYRSPSGENPSHPETLSGIASEPRDVIPTKIRGCSPRAPGQSPEGLPVSGASATSEPDASGLAARRLDAARVALAATGRPRSVPDARPRGQVAAPLLARREAGRGRGGRSRRRGSRRPRWCLRRGGRTRGGGEACTPRGGSPGKAPSPVPFPPPSPSLPPPSSPSALHGGALAPARAPRSPAPSTGREQGRRTGRSSAARSLDDRGFGCDSHMSGASAHATLLTRAGANPPRRRSINAPRLYHRGHVSTADPARGHSSRVSAR